MNILVMFSDQQHKYALGKMSRDFITPNLDSLADDGVLFRKAYSPSPVCGPYRGCLMTGQYVCHCRTYNNCDPYDDKCIPIARIMKDAGYSTSYIGKYHLGDKGNVPVLSKYREGFEHFMGYQCYNGFNPAAPYNNEVVFFDENNCEHRFDKHRTDVTTDLAIESLNQISKVDKPFFMMVSYQAPHYPEQPSKIYEDMYKEKEFEKMPGDKDIDPYTPTQSPRSKRPVELCPDFQNYGGNLKRYQQLYAALCTQVDAGVGRIIDFLKQNNMYDDTLIIYTSDHGDMQGHLGLKNKCYPYEKSCSVPMIMKAPKGRKGEVTDEVVSGVDLYPTIAEATGIKCPEDVDGTSIYGYLKGEKEHTQKYVISEIAMSRKPWRMITDGKLKLVTTLTYEPVELYDLVNDPYEITNRIGDGAFSKEIEVMLSTLKQKTCDIDMSRPAGAGNS